MTDEDVKAQYRKVVRRGRSFVFVACPLVLGLVLASRPLAARMGIAIGGTAVLGLWLAACAVLAIVGFTLGRCPACGAYIGSRPLHQWGRPRVCARCGVTLG